MIIIGILLLVVALAALGFVIYGSADAGVVGIDAFGLTVETSVLVLFLSGAAALLLAVLGLMALRAGARGAAKRRSEIGRLRRVEAEAKARQEEEAKARQQEAVRAAANTTPPGQSSAGAAVTGAEPAGTVTTEETTVLRRDPAPVDAPFGREPSSETVTMSKGTTEPGAGSTAAGDSTAGSEHRTADPGPKDRL